MLTSSDPVTCPGCGEINSPFEHLCKQCGAPLSAMGTLGPWERIQATGYAYRQATGKPPSRATLIGIWLIFGPTAVAIPLFLNRVRGLHVVPLLLIALVWFVAVEMLLRVTGNYYSRPQRMEDATCKDPESNGTWVCPACGEEVEAPFTDCWKCGAGRPDAT